MSNYKKPWRVKYRVRCEEWHPKSCPIIVDDLDRFILALPQTVDHPGMFDELAYNTAHEIVRSVNAMRDV